MKKSLIWLSLAIMFVISGCAKAANSEETTIVLKEYSINPEKTALKNSETPIEIQIKNEGTDDHNFVIEELGIDSGILAPGEKVNVSFDLKESGEFKAVCTLPGHTEAGMV
jgi:plastocyanin